MYSKLRKIITVLCEVYKRCAAFFFKVNKLMSLLSLYFLRDPEMLPSMQTCISWIITCNVLSVLEFRNNLAWFWY